MKFSAQSSPGPLCDPQARLDALGAYLADVLGHLDASPRPSASAGAEALAELLVGHLLRAREYHRLAEEIAGANARRLTRSLEERSRAEAEVRAAYEQLQETQRQLVQMEKLSALGTLVGGVAHEINNPLMGINGYLAFAIDRLEEGQPREMLRRAAREVERIGRIVRNMLVFARANTGLTLGPVELARAVRDTVALVASELAQHEIELALDAAGPPVWVRCNLDNLQQALLNLLLNARDALRGRPPPRRLAVTVAEAGQVRIADNGPGVPAAIRDRIFDPFFTTKAAGQGTGLGLAVSRQLIEAAGGRLALAEAGEGAAFVISLAPAEAAEPG